MTPTPRILAIYGSYKTTELAVLDGNTVIAVSTDDSTRASSSLIPSIQQMLTAHNLVLSDINFIAADCGPGAFTSLRVAISTINGIGFSSNIPLIGIDGLDALAHEVVSQQQLPDGAQIVCMLNAYNKEVYHAIYTVVAGEPQRQGESGYSAHQTFIRSLKDHMGDQSFMCAGNGAQLYAAEIAAQYGEQATIIQIPHASAPMVGKQALQAILAGETGSARLLPQYLKSQNFATR